VSDYSELKRLAEQATPGPWTHCPSACSNPYSGKLYDHTVYYVEPGAFSPGTRIAETMTQGSWAHGNKTAKANAAFIAAASPDVVLALLSDLAAANRRAEAMRGVVEAAQAWVKADDARVAASIKLAGDLTVENEQVLDRRELAADRAGDMLHNACAALEVNE
jgi:hypothetical protein